MTACIIDPRDGGWEHVQWIAGEIKINGVDIYRSGQDTGSTAKKVNLINSFADETGVFATYGSNSSGKIAITLNSVNNRPISGSMMA